ncbi:hypothetical protein [uncultured Bifidobacterium sp.]|uniref:hypothetical protein n=1 Tax=uncultured Bifidobacterium sp. TaxID=165187 RepID=UPI0025915E74|nr:hypothetical protein [uncultured Bifidobacterium sp.]
MNTKRLYCAVLAAGLLILTGCGTVNASPQHAPTGSSTEVASAKIASSLSERIQNLLAMNDTMAQPMSEKQIAILKRALDHDGKVSKTDYDQAWSNYQQCVIDKGYAAPTSTIYSDGIRGSTTVTDADDRGEDALHKAQDDSDACRLSEYQSVDEMYRLSLGNPQLYADRDEGFVDCLKRKELVDPSYTAQQFKKEFEQSGEEYSANPKQYPPKEAWQKSQEVYSFDFYDSQVQYCFATNGHDVKTWAPESDEGVWHPFRNNNQ